MSLDIKIKGISKISTQSKVEYDDNGSHLITKFTMEAEISPSDLARIHNLARQPVVLNASISTDQTAFDCLLVDERAGAGTPLARNASKSITLDAGVFDKIASQA